MNITSERREERAELRQSEVTNIPLTVSQAIWLSRLLPKHTVDAVCMDMTAVDWPRQVCAQRKAIAVETPTVRRLRERAQRAFDEALAAEKEQNKSFQSTSRKPSPAMEQICLKKTGGHSFTDKEAVIEQLWPYFDPSLPASKRPDVEFAKATVGTVPADDPRFGLRGQSALYCSAPVARGEILGAFAGRVSLESEYNREEATRLSTYSEHERYAYHLSVKLPRKHLPKGDLDRALSRDTLIVDPLYEYGNKAMVMNDLRLNPLKVDTKAAAESSSSSGSSKSSSSAGKKMHYNVSFIEVTHKGWPYVFVIALKKIQVGDEFLVVSDEQIRSNFFHLLVCFPICDFWCSLFSFYLIFVG